MDPELDTHKLNEFFTSDKFNPDDYSPAEEENAFGNYINLMNIFTVYFRNLFKKNPTLNMFEGVNHNKLDSTSRQMELFYEHLNKYREMEHTCANTKTNTKTKNDDAISIYPIEDININECEELYILKFDNKEFGCQYLIPLISLLSQQDWTNIKWTLLPVKRED